MSNIKKLKKIVLIILIIIGVDYVIWAIVPLRKYFEIYEEKWNIDIIEPVDTKEIYGEEYSRLLYKHNYSDEQIEILKKQEYFKPMRERLVKYYINDIFLENLDKESDTETFNDNFDWNILNTEENLYAYFEVEEYRCYGLLILDFNSQNLYNFIDCPH